MALDSNGIFGLGNMSTRRKSGRRSWRLGGGAIPENGQTSERTTNRYSKDPVCRICLEKLVFPEGMTCESTMSEEQLSAMGIC